MKSHILCAVLILAAFSIAAAAEFQPYPVKVLVIRYFPLDPDSGSGDDAKVDIRLTGDYGPALTAARAHVQSVEDELVIVLNEASRYHAYKNALAKPSLHYEIVKRVEHLADIPLVKGKLPERWIDHHRLLMDNDIRTYVDKHGVREVWLWANWPAVKGHNESKMSSCYGDVSNSGRLNDMPICDRTYILYNYNPGRGLDCAMEDHMHQIEAQLREVDAELFWGKFVGPCGTQEGDRRCGWAHYPPNGRGDYDWNNEEYVWTDAEDWTPEGTGQKQRMNCQRWGCNSVGFFTWWMQNLPGQGNALTYNGKRLRNWCEFVGDWDTAMEEQHGLTYP